jgi:hypothetical protein
MNADSIIKYQQILKQNGKQPNLKKVLELMGWNDEDVEDMQMIEIESENNTTNQNLLSNDDVNKEDDNRKKANTKRNVANNKGVGQQMWNP